MKNDKRIWVIAPGCTILNKEHILQLICKAEEFSRNNGYLVELIYMNEAQEELLRELVGYSERILYVKASCGQGSAGYLDILEKLVETRRPELIIFPATVLGKELAAAAAVQIHAGLVADCIDIRYEQQRGFVFYRPALAATVIAKIVCENTSISICTIKNNIFTDKCKTALPYNTVIEEYQDAGTEVFEKKTLLEVLNIEPIKNSYHGNLLHSRIVFGAGRGIQDAATMELLKSIADKVGAAVGGSRHIIENGWLPKSNQIGQTGVSIHPDIYVAFGISGALQHVVGIKNAKRIVAVNKDKEAPIMNYADYIILGDVEQVLADIHKML